MAISFKVEDVLISAVRDRAMFNSFAGDNSYVIKNIGNELSVTYSSSSFVVELGTGEAVICGGSMYSEGSPMSLTLPASSSGYLVIEIDLSQTGSNICQFKNVSSLVQGNINNGDMIYDLPLYQYTTNGTGVSNCEDIRNIRSSLVDTSIVSGGKNAVSGGAVYTALAGKAPKNHATTATTYGVGTSTNYGHLKIANNLTTTTTGQFALDAVQGKALNDSKAPNNHAVTTNTYGLGSTTKYGHNKVVNNLTTSAHADGLSLSAYQGKVLNDKINTMNATHYASGGITWFTSTSRTVYVSSIHNVKTTYHYPFVTLILDLSLKGTSDSLYQIGEWAYLQQGQPDSVFLPKYDTSINVLPNASSGNPYIKIGHDGKFYVGGWQNAYSGFRLTVTYVSNSANITPTGN